MVFRSKKEQERRQKASAQCKQRNEQTRRRKRAARGEVVSIGRRIVDLALLSQKMWCDTCDLALSFRYLEEERQIGCASIFKLKCHTCLVTYEVPTSSNVPNDSPKPGPELFAVNCKLALGSIDTGIGQEQLNKFLSAANLPTIHRNTMKNCENRVGPAVLQTARESCREALLEEKCLTLEARDADVEPMDLDDPSPSQPSTSSTEPGTLRSRRQQHRTAGITYQDDDDEEEVVDIIISYDFGWDKRGNGFQYNSDSGRASAIGKRTKKILAFKVVHSYCYMCARGLHPNNHVCVKNYEESSKGMEPFAAVDILLKNPDLKWAGVRVTTIVADKDSSTLAALRTASTHPITKVIDMNDNIKSVNNALYKMKKGQHKFLTANSINYLKRCVCYAIAQNAGNVSAVEKVILNVVPHTFGEHNDCPAEWCRAKNNASYEYKHLPAKQPFSNPAFREDLEALMAAQAGLADELAPLGYSLQNESFNHMCNTRAPKGRHYSGTQALDFRVGAAVCFKNYGAEHLDRSFQTAHLSPSVSNHRKSVERRCRYKADRQGKVEMKKRRLFLKMRKEWKDSASINKEGLTYVSGMANTMERAVDASRVSSWLPEPRPLRSTCRPVIVDIETTGLGSNAEIVQIAAKCGDEEFTVFIVPQRPFDAEASQVTGMTVIEGSLFRHGELLVTVPAAEAAQAFLDFLKTCSEQVILEGHNIVRFDGPRIMRFVGEHQLAKELCSLVFGLTDTLPLVSQDKIRKQDALANKYLKGNKWTELRKKAHDALADCCILQGLLDHFKVDTAAVTLAVLPITDFMERCAANGRKKLLPQLLVMQPHGVSKAMIGRMAGQGVTMRELIGEYSNHGRKGLEVCLGVQIDGKPRITKSKKVLGQVEAYLVSRIRSPVQ